MWYTLVLVIIIGVLIYLLLKRHVGVVDDIKDKTDTISRDASGKQLPDKEYIATAYKPRWMFSFHEKDAYYKLCAVAKKRGLCVFAKVRLLDLVEPISGVQRYKSNLYRVQSKHVDFVLTTEKLVAKYVIELDDSSHDKPDRIERDRFVDAVLMTCGYKVLHVREVEASVVERFLCEQ